MYPKSRDLEIVYNLVWRSKPHQSDDRANIVGMYDIPSTTLNWDNFKSYLLKNSGSSASDIKVSYIDSDEKEVPINDQNDFQLALYSFRRRARIGEIITLKVDKINKHKIIKQLIQSTDAEIQTLEFKDEATQPQEPLDEENPPKWFTKYMKKFEKKMTEDIKQQFGLYASKMQSTSCPHSHPTRSKATKPESYKRSRKFDLTKVNMDKDLCKQFKFEKKLESKLEKLEHKTTKLKAKKLAAMKVSSDSDVGRGPIPKNYQSFETSADPQMPLNNVTLNRSSDKTTGPLYVNSIYLQTWEVTNTGQSAWDERTELRYAWGSEKLRPTFTILTVPELQPGEKGEISVWFQIPSTPGQYDCYWHFYDCGRRFGQWLGCELTVIEDPFRPRLASPLPVQNGDCSFNGTEKLESVELHQQPKNIESTEEMNKRMDSLALADTSSVNNLNYTPKCDLSSDSDNISILSGGSNSPHSASSDYVVIHSPDSTNVEKNDVINDEAIVSNVENEKDEPASTSDILDVVSVASEANADREVRVAEHENSEYAYIYYNGEKYPFHKDYLRAEYFNEAEKCTDVQVDSSESSSCKIERIRKHSSSSSQDSGKRLFIFPRHSPGFEVVYPSEPKSPLSCDGEDFLSFNNDASQGQTSSVSIQETQFGEEVTVVNSTTTPTNVPATPTYGEARMTMSTTYTSPQMSSSVQPTQKQPPKINGHVLRPEPNHEKPENIFTGAAILASSAMSTARNVVNMVINPGNGKWVNGHWVADNENSKRENALKLLGEMGFANRDLNATLLARYNDDVEKVICELLQ